MTVSIALTGSSICNEKAEEGEGERERQRKGEIEREREMIKVLCSL